MKKNLLRRLTCLLVVLAIVLSCSASALAYTCSIWATTELASVEEAGIIPDNLTDANLTLRMTRQEMCDVVVHTFEQMTGTNLYPRSTAHFKDTTNANVCIAAELCIVDGYSNGNFGPNDTITREQFAKVVENFYLALGWNKYTAANPDIPTAKTFSDYNKTSAWAKGVADTVVSIGIIKGNASNKLMPLNSCSREEALIMMLRTYKYMMDFLNIPLPDMTASEAVELPAEETETASAAATPEESQTDGAAVTESTQSTAAVSDEPTYRCSAWAKADMAEAYFYGIMPESLIHADLTQKITRQEICYTSVCTFMSITDTSGDPESTDHFTDTDDPIINLAFELGLVSGGGNGTFCPDDLMTREQLFMIIANLLNATGWKDPSVEDQGDVLDRLASYFTDAASISAWAASAAATMYEAGVLKGDGTGKMNPGANTTREQGLIMFLRAYRYIEPWYAEHPLTEITGPIVANDEADALVQFALQFEGYPYVWAGKDPSGFDCSGFIYYIFNTTYGYNISRVASSQMLDGEHVEYDELRPGDIIGFWDRDHTYIGHVGLYIGDGKMIHAQSSSTGVCISDVTPGSYYYGRYYEARRIIN